MMQKDVLYNTPDTKTPFNVKIGNLRGHFAQLLRYAAPADARSTIVQLRSTGTASLALGQNFSLKKWIVVSI
ncbi:MAG: hypothetical protein ACYS9Y_13080 [Planctomycetota bacterium]|jgi:hypothetical protein